jgi:hypothetical protein
MAPRSFTPRLRRRAQRGDAVVFRASRRELRDLPSPWLVKRIVGLP